MPHRYGDRDVILQSFDRCPACNCDTFIVRRVYLSVGEKPAQEVTIPLTAFIKLWQTLGIIPAGVAILAANAIWENDSATTVATVVTYGLPLVVAFIVNGWWKSTHPWVAKYSCRSCQRVSFYKPGDPLPREKFDLARTIEERRRQEEENRRGGGAYP